MSKLGSAYIGCLIANTKAVFAISDSALVKKKIEHTFILRWKEGVFSKPVSLNWTACSIVKPNWIGVECVVIGNDGSIALFFTDDSYRIHDKLISQTERPQTRFRSACFHQDSIWMVGASQICVSLDSRLEYIDRSPSLVSSQSTVVPVAFEACCSDNRDIFYCAGWDGALCSFRGDQWITESSTTNMILSSLCASPNGEIYAVGQGGTLVHGRSGQWKSIPQAISENLWSCVWFEDTVYAASSQQLFILDTEEFCTVELPDNPKTFYHLDANGASLMSTGADDLLLLLPTEMLRLI